MSDGGGVQQVESVLCGKGDYLGVELELIGGLAKVRMAASGRVSVSALGLNSVAVVGSAGASFKASWSRMMGAAVRSASRAIWGGAGWPGVGRLVR